MARKKNTDELSELDQAYSSIAGKKPKAKHGKGSTFLIVVSCILLLATIGGVVWFVFCDHWLKMPDVTVAGVNMTGMTRHEAKLLLEQLVAERYAAETMTVTVSETTVTLPAAEMQIQIDVQKSINYASRTQGEYDMTPFITLNEAKLDQVLAELGQQYNTELQPTRYEVEGILPDLSHGEPQEGQTLVVIIGQPELGLDVPKLKEQILGAYSRCVFHVDGEFSEIAPEFPGAEKLYEEHLTAPVDAVMDMKTFEISREKYGYSVDKAQAEALLTNLSYGDVVRIPFAKVAPQATYDGLYGTLYQDILGECSTPYSGGDNNSRNTNLRLACEKIDGTILLPGEVFSYNMTLGERTKENGWKPAPSYVNGLTVDTYGGGICQGSTTLYNCVLQADFKLVECYPHGYISSYVDPGLDASVNWGTADFRFENTSAWPVKIEAYRKNGKMTMRIYGTDEKDYYVKMSYKVVSKKDYEVVYKEIDPENNPEKYEDGEVIITPYTGYRVKTYKNRYNKENGKLIETVLERDFTYSHRDKVVVKFLKTETETTPPATP